MKRAMICLGLGVAGSAVLAAATAPAPAPRVLARIQPGQWTLRGLDAAPRSMCIADPAMLLQLRHPGPGCSRTVLEDGPSQGQVHYSCPGHGYGDTVVRVETPSLIHVDSQGVADNAPFNMSVEARRTGACSGRAPG